MGVGWHSRIVALARVALPVAALGLMSMLFLFARTVDPLDALPFAEVDVAARARDQQITAPRVSGRTEGGTAFRLVAERAVPAPDDPRRMGMDRMHLTLEEAGADTTVIARHGTVDMSGRTVVLEGDVQVDDVRGFHVRSDRLEGELATLRVASPGPVTGDTPFGTVDAGAFTITEEAGARRLSFTDGVELLYQPPD